MLTGILLIVFALECLLLLGWGLRQPERIYQFPFLAAAVFSGWVFPQLLGLSHRPEMLPEYSLEKTLIVTILCFGMCYWGYVSANSSALLKRFDWQYNENRMLISAMILSLAGAYFFWKISIISQKDIDSMSGQWSGIITIYAFFSKLVGFGLAIAAVSFLRFRSRFALAIILFDGFFYLRNIFIGGRRGPTVELVCMIIILLWLYRGILLPRWVMIVSLVCGALLVNNIGSYRSITGARELPTLAEISKIEFIGNLKEIYSGSSGNEELRNAAYIIAATDEALNVDFGLGLWNSLVFQYIPAQFLGREFKESLLIDLPDNARNIYGHVPWTGSTVTGMSDSFRSFWYFGPFLFYLIGALFSKLYDASLAGNIAAQLFLVSIISNGLHSITHGVYWFFGSLPQVIIFIMPVLIYSAIKSDRFSHSVR